MWSWFVQMYLDTLTLLCYNFSLGVTHIGHHTSLQVSCSKAFIIILGICARPALHASIILLSCHWTAHFTARVVRHWNGVRSTHISHTETWRHVDHARLNTSTTIDHAASIYILDKFEEWTWIFMINVIIAIAMSERSPPLQSLSLTQYPLV